MVLLFIPHEISGIVDLMLGELKKRLADKEVGFAITDAAKDYVINNGFDPQLRCKTAQEIHTA